MLFMHSTSPAMEAPVCFGTRCLSWRAARQIVQERGGWQAALPVAAGSANGSLRCALRGTQTPLEGSVDAKGCVPIGTGWGGYTNVCACSDLAEFNARQPRGEFGGSVLVLTNATERVHALDKATLAFRDPFEGTNRSLPRPAKNVLIRKGWVPVLTRAVYAWFKPPVISPLPCSSSRGSDAVVLRSFFTDAHGRVLQSPGAVFLEAGAYDGLIESNTWFFERCLGWRGILVEGQPSLSEQLLVNRPATLNVREASCSKRGLVKYSARPLGHRAGGASIGGISTHQGIVDERDSSGVAVQCAPLGSRLAALDVRRIDLLVLDVEGQELAVLRTIDFAWTAIGVLVVEVRGDGSRASIMRLLLRTGKFAYVGQIHGRPSTTNDVVDDVFVNVRFLRMYWPASRAFQSLPPELGRRGKIADLLHAHSAACTTVKGKARRRMDRRCRLFGKLGGRQRTNTYESMANVGRVSARGVARVNPEAN